MPSKRNDRTSGLALSTTLVTNKGDMVVQIAATDAAGAAAATTTPAGRVVRLCLQLATVDSQPRYSFPSKHQDIEV